MSKNIYNPKLFASIAEFVTRTVDSNKTDVGRLSCWHNIEDENNYSLVKGNTVYGNGEFMVFKDNSKAYLNFCTMRFAIK